MALAAKILGPLVFVGVVLFISLILIFVSVRKLNSYECKNFEVNV